MSAHASTSARWLPGVSLVLVTLAAASCTTGPTAAVVGEFVGQLPGSNAFVAIVTDGTEVRAYVCDGTSQGVSISEWFKGTTAARNAVDLTSLSGNAQLTAELRLASVTGTIRLPDGRTLAFEAAPASGNAGLFAFKNQMNASPTLSSVSRQVQLTAGWVIIIPEGVEQQRGAISGGQAPFHVRLDTSTGAPNTGTADVPDVGTITAGKVTPIDVQRFFSNGWP